MMPVNNRVIVFSRYPEPGVTKTRMIPALGAERAAQLQQALTKRTLAVVNDFGADHSCDLEVRFAGGEASRMSRMFGAGLTYRSQSGGDLGQRLTDAFATAFHEGATRVVVMGSDCPEIDSAILDEAFNALSHVDVVLGPAIDGGYYLIGLSANQPHLFEKIEWGSENVLRQTARKAKQSRCKVHYLQTLSDVDYPEDLVVCRRFPETFDNVLPRTREGMLSVIVPTLNEEQCLEQTLRGIVGLPNVEVIVTDGGSEDRTIDIARHMGATVVLANPGRGCQMNAGAAVASGDVLLFLHADTQLPESFHQHVRATLQRGVIAAAFSLLIDGDHFGLRWIEKGVNFRSRFLGRPYGDQGLFVSAKSFYKLGGFPNWPLMEDVELCRRLRKRGAISLAEAAVTTSARRWLRLGILKTTLINQLCIASYHLGVSPAKLDQWYRSRRWVS
ncbi:TIGR04283 family arsenosugar biosynthesis glycosyltransferase [Aporhodopirellula aestuarii]|uniref:TIGR04283 family arsenosugar biosynthesis glycosyltransferase n=1 Tax=Aporhodopirellula aestuarii TaxID=2950107 RepID=A0ABT0UAQ6_9BACT|nr:TIGR04283 family arsenosugar biosynthesis glycosyltransferase [Aporhodopirellula aestuarii]MCM2373966.1 TIGR04283 family arsenosugar biosynthesis glycosyltransferase [Aporhodopirellula aestuarii]